MNVKIKEIKIPAKNFAAAIPGRINAMKGDLRQMMKSIFIEQRK